MIRYKSTRGDKKLYTFSEAILKGIARDGGLLVPEKIPTFSLEKLRSLFDTSYAEKALFVLDLFETDIPHKTVKILTEQAYGEKSHFPHGKVAPLVHYKENEYILELWHGPTSAFKDMALQLMPLLFSEAIHMNNANRLKNNEKALHYLILVATSGDTGKAALEGYKNRDNISLIVFFSDKRVSLIQALSMITQDGKNLAVYPLSGDFDDAQHLVKLLFNDAHLNQKLFDQYTISLSAANSINWGRFLPQIVYHISAYCDLVKQKSIRFGDEIDIAIPCGNFSNMLGAWIAKRMGLPVRKFICASNENNVLSEFLQTGIFDAAKRSMIATPSPAMDILIPSNIERLLYFITQDTAKISNWMEEMKEKRRFTIDDATKKKLQEIFCADWVRNEDCLQRIKKTFEEKNYVIDPHTAVVVEVVNRYKKKVSDTIPIVMCSTAHWAKFPEAVSKALLNKSDNSLNEFAMIEKIQQITNSPVPKNISALKNKPILHTKKLKIDKNIIENEILNFLDKKIYT